MQVVIAYNIYDVMSPSQGHYIIMSHLRKACILASLESE